MLRYFPTFFFPHRSGRTLQLDILFFPDIPTTFTVPRQVQVTLKLFFCLHLIWAKSEPLRNQHLAENVAKISTETIKILKNYREL